jgi:hypothetical protein
LVFRRHIRPITNGIKLRLISPSYRFAQRHDSSKNQTVAEAIIMKLSLTSTLIICSALTAVSLPASANGRHHHHGHHRHWGAPAYYMAPPVVVRPYVPAPVYYAPPPPVYYRAPAVAVPGRGVLPIVAGGVVGGLVGNQLGYGDPGAIIAGSVAGSVIGHEIAH